MPYFRSISRPIRTLAPPSMGQDWNSPDNSNPSSFNDLANQYRAIDQAGWVAPTLMSQNVGGRLRPLCGDYGPTFTHTVSNVTEMNIEIPQMMTHFSCVVYMRSISPLHLLYVDLRIDRLGVITTQQLFSQNSTSLATTFPRPYMISGALQAPFVSGTGIEDAKMILTFNKTSTLGGSSATNMGNMYADGIFSAQVKFFR